MKKSTPQTYKGANSFLFALIILSLSSCGTFRKAVHLVKQNEIEKAVPLLEKSLKHKTYGPGAKFYLERTKINKEPTTLNWLGISQTFCDLADEVSRLPTRQVIKLSRYDAARGDINISRENLQKRIFEQMSIQGTVPELLALEEKNACWSEGAIDSLRHIVVNKTIDDSQQVYDTKADKKWEGIPLTFPTEDQILTDPGRSCLALTENKSWNLNYEDATAIAHQYGKKVLTVNYATFWGIQRNIWNIFSLHNSYCEMDRFKKEHPNSGIANDCWFDAAHDTLCMSQLRPLLAFHRNNPHTVLDIDICLQILCLAAFAEDALTLNAQERKQLKDVRDMINLRADLRNCTTELDSTEIIEKVVYFAQNYPHHRLVFNIAQKAMSYFTIEGQLLSAKEALISFRPLFPDSSVCYTNFEFQVGKQDWFDGFEGLLNRPESENFRPLPVPAWNTDEYDEYGLVSWGETDEVFFVRKNPGNGAAQILTSKLEKEEWTKPVQVLELSISHDIVPLSMSANGQMMLLKSGGKLLRTYRPNIKRRWLKPEVMPIMKRFAGNAWISPDDSLLLAEYYTTAINALEAPKIDISVSRMDEDGAYHSAVSISKELNLAGSDEGRPGMALGGRLLFFSSDRKGGLGERDMYSATLTKPADWSTLGEPRNLGVMTNTIFDDEGLTYFSEYTGMAYFHSARRCTESMDIWQVKLGSGVFPENAMRLAGLVLDENRKPIGGGFVEFTPDYQLNVHAQPVSSKGTYTYTVPDSTEVVRLFPEIPGYYSERDTTHFLANILKGEIIHDTFLLTSFDYIRKHFKLVNSTFINGTAQFDNPEKAFPELTRLAKIATRMGAELELTGHTDNVGEEADNQKLSIDRATSVKAFLVEKCGFDPDRIRVHGYGSTRPICTNDTEEGRRCNRRIKITFKMPELIGQK